MATVTKGRKGWYRGTPVGPLISRHHGGANEKPTSRKSPRVRRDTKISIADRNLRDLRYCCGLVSHPEILTPARLPPSIHPPATYTFPVYPVRVSSPSPGVPELTVLNRSAVGQSSAVDCTQSAANWEMIGTTSADGIVPLTIPGPGITCGPI